MGQVCPQSAPSHVHYAPTKCQGVSTSRITERSKLQTSQPQGDSKVTSRGALCTQDDIRRSLRKDNTSEPSQTRSVGTQHSNKHRQHSHRSSGSSSGPREERRHASRSSLRDRTKGEEIEQPLIDQKRQTWRQQHWDGQRELVSLAVQRDSSQGGSNYLLRVEQHQQTQVGAGLQPGGEWLRHDPQRKDEKCHRHRHHYHRPDHCHRQDQQDQSVAVPRERKIEGKAKGRELGIGKRTAAIAQSEYLTQNAHNAKISAKRTQLPNSNLSTATPGKPERDAARGRMPPSPRSSLRDKKRIGGAGNGKAPEFSLSGDPVYALPPLVK
ncbi:uncharacterized protein [Diadema setosum]|uniref:uncharacterized protein n=1 Tax=Diadema setosum TaxID=31175 RepID=UPI003B3BACA3